MARLTENIRLGAPFGVPLAVQGLVLALVGIFSVYGLVTKSVAQAVWFPLLYGSILVHELAHALSTRALGGRVDGIVIHLVGGLTYSRGLKHAWAAVVMTAAGPVSNLALGALLWFVVLPALPPDGVAFVVLASLAFANIVWGIFNVLPIFPLDGGHILLTLLAQRLPTARATALSALISLVVIAATAVLSFSGAGLLGVQGLGSGMLLMFLIFFAWVNIQRWRGAAQAGASASRLVGLVGKGGRNGGGAPRRPPSAADRGVQALRDLAEDPDHMRRLLRRGAKVGLGGLSPDDRRLVMLHRTILEAELTRSGFEGLSDEQREFLALHHDMDDRSPPH